MKLKIVYKESNVDESMKYFVYRDNKCIACKNTEAEAVEVFEQAKASPRYNGPFVVREEDV